VALGPHGMTSVHGLRRSEMNPGDFPAAVTG
jgi:hypothetical protein